MLTRFRLTSLTVVFCLFLSFCGSSQPACASPPPKAINLWKHFGVICTLPRLSGKEEPVRQYIQELAKAKGLNRRRDAVGNLLVIVPATDNRRHIPALILHAHMDMVGDKVKTSPHDFTRDPISCRRDGDWLSASGTTLGADNGIGLAAMLALLDEPELSHGPLRLLFTVDEEGGFTGADGIDPAFLQAPRLLNLDSEEGHEFNIGCAGGVTHRTSVPLKTTTAPSGWIPLKVGVSGLTGGHSGVEIHHGRANAIRLLARLLMALKRESELLISSLSGGTFDTTIPREAEAHILVPSHKLPKVVKRANDLAGIMRREYQTTDSGISFEIKVVNAKAEDLRVWPASFSGAVPEFLLAIPAGVRVMSSEFPGLVETSANPGVLETKPDQLIVSSHLQSSSQYAIFHLGARIARFAKPLAGVCCELSPYTPWKPREGSAFVQQAVGIHRRLFGTPPHLKVVHAGLECGSFARINPGLDMLSIGPSITGAHTPNEKVSISSVEDFWKMLVALLETPET